MEQPDIDNWAPRLKEIYLHCSDVLRHNSFTAHGGKDSRSTKLALILNKT